MEKKKVIDTHAHLWVGEGASAKLDKMAEDGIISQAWVLAHECHKTTPTYQAALSEDVLLGRTCR